MLHPKYRYFSACKLFQSSPDPKAGCYLSGTRAHIALAGFNPHPTRRPDATCKDLSGWGLRKVSILTRPEGRMLLYFRESRYSGELFQSSPDPKAGCYAVALGEGASAGVSILTRPEGRMLHGVR